MLKDLIRKEKAYKLFDGQGLYIEVPPTGNLRWRIKYRFNGKENRLSLGLWPAVTLEVARMEAEKIQGQIKDNVDPSLFRKQNPITYINSLENRVSELESLLVDLRTKLRSMQQQIKDYIA